MNRFTRFCRFVDRDMMMRYHWGLAVGHTYGHRLSESNPPDPHDAEESFVGNLTDDRVILDHDEEIPDEDRLVGPDDVNDDAETHLGTDEGSESTRGDFDNDDEDILVFDEMYSDLEEDETID